MDQTNLVSLVGEHTIKQGADYRRTFQCFDRDGLLVDLAGATAKCQFRRSPISSVFMLEATTANEKLSIDGANGCIFLLLTGADTDKLTHDGIYDCVVTLTTGEILRAFQGPFRVDPKVTR